MYKEVFFLFLILFGLNSWGLLAISDAFVTPSSPLMYFVSTIVFDVSYAYKYQPGINEPLQKAKVVGIGLHLLLYRLCLCAQVHLF